MPEFGIALKSVKVQKNREKSLELYLAGLGVVYTKHPVGHTEYLVHTEVLQHVRRGAWKKFGGDGLVIVPPVEVPTDAIVAVQIALMESDEGARRFGERMSEIGGKVAGNGGLLRAVAGGSVGAATAAIGTAFKVAIRALTGNKDDQLLAWAGSWKGSNIQTGDVEVYDERARMTLRVMER